MGGGGRLSVDGGALGAGEGGVLRGGHRGEVRDVLPLHVRLEVKEVGVLVAVLVGAVAGSCAAAAGSGGAAAAAGCAGGKAGEVAENVVEAEVHDAVKIACRFVLVNNNLCHLGLEAVGGLGETLLGGFLEDAPIGIGFTQSKGRRLYSSNA